MVWWMWVETVDPLPGEMGGRRCRSLESGVAGKIVGGRHDVDTPTIRVKAIHDLALHIDVRLEFGRVLFVLLTSDHDTFASFPDLLDFLLRFSLLDDSSSHSTRDGQDTGP